jgi:tetratricopeptide (TPR) repeat protein
MFDRSRRRLGRWGVALLVLATLGCLPAAMASAEVKAHDGTIEIPTYPWWPAGRHPYFRGTDGRNIYPYPMFDNLKRVKEPHTWRTVVLENEYLRVTFLPDLGGKIYDVLDKSTGKSMFYVNRVIKPGLIGQCGAWTSGGVEWNTGPTGHTVGAVQPMSVEILPPATDGSRSVAVGEVERIYRTHWTVVVTLRPGRAFLEEHVRIYNATETVRPYYFWNCTAMPNTPGFRFIYPMTLGTDHSGKVFFRWPISEGKDLSLGRSYQDASSIFAYECDQDFFGAYDEDANRGVVAYANHHQLVGKKAWTWGQGSYGQMYERDLTDNDGPYNEVQTGPLPTQAEVGRLDPLEAVEWNEWWYPVHGIAGFSFANREVAVNADPEARGLRLRLIGTGTWDAVEVRLWRGTNVVARGRTKISPRQPAELKLAYPGAIEPVEVELVSGKSVLARFRVPLDLPVRTPPSPQQRGETPSELAQAGWQDYLFARFPEAESRFNQALAKDSNAVPAWTGLAYYNLDRGPAWVPADSQAALTVDPENGLAWYALAVGQLRLNNPALALEPAWKACLDPATAIPARALVGKILLQRGDWDGAVRALSAPGPWRCDSVCRNRLGFALWRQGDKAAAIREAHQNLAADPLDAFARSLLWLADAGDQSLSLGHLIRHQAQATLELAADYASLGQLEIASRVFEDFYFKSLPEKEWEPIPCYWAAWLSERLQKQRAAADYRRAARAHSSDGVFPHRIETIPILRWALAVDSQDGKAALYLGHLLFSLGRYAEGRTEWQRAADLGESTAIAYRALGMACRQLDNDLNGAAKFLERANQADTQDSIVAADLARVRLALADQEKPKDKVRELIAGACEVLTAALAAGRERSDFVVLLARAQNRLGEFAETARLLDSVRIRVWEGSREAHDLFEQAHVGLGRAALAAGRNADALAEFNRALEYPENLATGKLEGAREAPIHYLRGQALAALGQKAAAIEAWKKATNGPPSNNPQEAEARKLAREALDRAK